MRRMGGRQAGGHEAHAGEQHMSRFSGVLAQLSCSEWVCAQVRPVSHELAYAMVLPPSNFHSFVHSRQYGGKRPRCRGPQLAMLRMKLQRSAPRFLPHGSAVVEQACVCVFVSVSVSVCVCVFAYTSSR